MKTAWTEETLEALPRDDVFRLRGNDMTRLDTFVDAAFAFAVTLLVISIDSIPDSYDGFIEALLQTPAFLACFLQLMMFWLGHRAWSRRYGLETKAVIWISLSLVAGILVIVYPLRLMFGAAFAFISNGYIPSEIQFTVEQMRTVFILYGTGFGILSSLIAILFWLAARAKNELMLSAEELLATQSDVHGWLILTLTGVTSVFIALLADGLWVLWAGWVYAALAIIMPLQDQYAARQMARLREQ